MRPLPFLLAGRLVPAPLHQHMAARRGWVGVCGVFFFWLRRRALATQVGKRAGAMASEQPSTARRAVDA
jgi:hypothetical protein